MSATLTVKKCAKLLRNGAVGIYSDRGSGAVRGLRLIIRSKTNAAWLLRFQLNHRSRYMGLGSASTFSLAEARARARVARKLLADDVDPLDVKHAERDARRADTFAPAGFVS